MRTPLFLAILALGRDQVFTYGFLNRSPTVTDLQFLVYFADIFVRSIKPGAQFPGRFFDRKSFDQKLQDFCLAGS